MFVFAIRARSACTHRSPFKTANQISFTVQTTFIHQSLTGDSFRDSTRNYRFETKNHMNTKNSMVLMLNKQKCRKRIQMLMFLFYSYKHNIEKKCFKYITNCDIEWFTATTLAVSHYLLFSFSAEYTGYVKYA